MNLSFSGCGFLGIYHLGVAKTFASEGKKFITEVQRYGGASAGALIASLFAVHGADEEVVEKCRSFCLGLAEDINSKALGVLTPGLELLKPLEKFIEELFPDDAHVRATGRLFVSVTNTVTKENEIISEFSSRENLIQFLLASSCIPFITASKSISIGEKKYCDGGLTDNLPTFPEGETIKVSPFEGKHDISPSISAICTKYGGDDKGPHFTVVNQNFKVSLDNLTRGIHIFSPPSMNILRGYYNQGAEDARKFLIDRGYHNQGESNGSQGTRSTAGDASTTDLGGGGIATTPPSDATTRTDRVDVTTQPMDTVREFLSNLRSVFTHKQGGSSVD